MKKQPKKLFIVRKYIMAKNAQEAIRLDKIKKVDDVWVDDDWKSGNRKTLESAIGFLHYEDNSSLDWDEIAKKKKK
jgi:hypothetical protein